MGGKQFAFLVAGDYPNDLNKLSTCLIAEGFKVIVVAERTAIIHMAIQALSVYFLREA